MIILILKIIATVVLFSIQLLCVAVVLGILFHSLTGNNRYCLGCWIGRWLDSRGK